MSLVARAEVRLGQLPLSVDLTVAEDETVAVLGPNGAGKTTLLRVLAGLQPVDRGRVELDGEVLDDAESGRFVPPEARPVGMVFQDHRLLPHLSVLDNVAFGLRPGRRRSAAREAARAWLDRVGLADRARDLPSELSGGQRQRVALARALALEPRLLLLDEPLAALDAPARVSVRRELREVVAGFEGMRVLVTHDPVEAAQLADRVIVLEGGAVVQEGSLVDLAAHPRSRFAADLAGVNLWQGTGADGVLHLEGGAAIVSAERAPDGPALAVVHPRAVALHRDHPEGSARNTFSLTVASLEVDGERVRVRLDGVLPLVAEVTAGAVRELGLVEGSAVWAAVKATEVAIHPA